MRVGYVQFNPVFGRKEANLERVAGFLDGARADLVVLPELFSTGYVFGSREELLEAAEDTNGKTFTALADLSRRSGMETGASIRVSFLPAAR